MIGSQRIGYNHFPRRYLFSLCRPGPMQSYRGPVSPGEEKVRGRTSKAGKRGSADPSEPLVPTVILWGTVWILKEKI